MPVGNDCDVCLLGVAGDDMKFKLFEIIWDMSVPLAAIWGFIGCALIGGMFWIDEMNWFAILYCFAVVAYAATAESVVKKLMGE